MNKHRNPDPSAEVFAVLPGSLNPPSEPSGDWWVDLQELDLDPPFEPTGDDELLRLDFMGQLQFMALQDRLFYRRGFGFGRLASPLLTLRLWVARRRLNQRLLHAGFDRIPTGFKPGSSNGRF